MSVLHHLYFGLVWSIFTILLDFIRNHWSICYWYFIIRNSSHDWLIPDPRIWEYCSYLQKFSDELIIFGAIYTLGIILWKREFSILDSVIWNCEQTALYKLNGIDSNFSPAPIFVAHRHTWLSSRIVPFPFHFICICLISLDRLITLLFHFPFPFHRPKSPCYWFYALVVGGDSRAMKIEK